METQTQFMNLAGQVSEWYHRISLENLSTSTNLNSSFKHEVKKKNPFQLYASNSKLHKSSCILTYTSVLSKRSFARLCREGSNCKSILVNNLTFPVQQSSRRKFLWLPVYIKQAYSVQRLKFNTVEFIFEIHN